MFNIYAFADEADKSIDGQINAMLRNNLKGLEIRGVDGENISDISLEKAKEVKKKLFLVEARMAIQKCCTSHYCRRIFTGSKSRIFAGI